MTKTPLTNITDSPDTTQEPSTRHRISRATSADDVAAVKAMFLAYQAGLGVDLCFQGFEEEMATFPAKYDLLLIAKTPDGRAEGCVGLWSLEGSLEESLEGSLGDRACEMKRLYVHPAARGTGLGRALSVALMDAARTLGFTVMKLDTLERLTPAVALYRSLGFTETPAYNENPEADILYFQRAL